MHSKWGAIATVLCLSGCALLGPGADPDDDDNTEEGGSVHIGGSGYGGSSGSSGSSGGVPTPAGYLCSEASTMCRCSRVAFGSPGRCMFDWTCCIESENADMCDCFESDACAAEVASRPGARQVETCPGNADQLPIACAQEAENCTRAVLDQNELDGCCEGLVCAPNESGVRTCRAGSDEEIQLAERCADTRTDGLTTSGSLATSAGPIPIVTVEASLFKLGADGCVASSSLVLSPSTDNAGGLSCGLRAQVGPGRDAEGRLIVGGLQLIAMPLFGCTGYPPGVDGLYMGGTAAGTLAFEGLSCEGSAGSEQCVAGRFTLALEGELTGMRIAPDPAMSSVSLAFENASVTLEGRLCDYSPQGAACTPGQ